MVWSVTNCFSLLSDVVTSSTSVRLPFGVSADVLSPAFSSELAVVAGLGEGLELAVSPLKA